MNDSEDITKKDGKDLSPLMKKIKKIFWWVIFSVFVAPTLIGVISDLTAGIGCKKFGSGAIGTSNDDDFFKSLDFEPSLWTKINPVEGWDAPPEWLKEWLEAK